MSLDVKKYGVKDIVKIPLYYSKRNAIVIAGLKILSGLSSTLCMLAIAKFINATVLVFNGQGSYSSIIFSVFLVAVCTAYLWFSPHIVALAETKLENKLRESLRVSLVEKVASLKYNYIENQESWDLISRVCKQPEIQCTEAYGQFFNMVSLIISILGVFTVLFTQVWWSAVIILLISVPLFMLAIKGGNATYQADREVEKYNRKVEYLSDVLIGRDAVEERTLFSFSRKVNEKWHEKYEKARKLQLKVRIKWFIKVKSGGIIIALLSSIIILILIFPVKSGALSIGLFISIINNLISLISNLSWQLPECADQLARNKGYLIDLENFLKLEHKEEFLDKPSELPIKISTLEFKNVSFKYPGMDRYILENMSFKIEQGKNYAFVGANGAGKTTITKLITGLYEDFEGEIIINGLSIKEYSQSKLKSMFSVVYQDFARYYISFKDNVAFGNINNCSMEDIEKALNIVDLKNEVEVLPKGIESNLGKVRQGGVDLSGGQWQRIAMSRAIVSSASCIILDEPTAALDPISESDVYRRFEEISKGETTIFISHRLASTKLADEIFVISNGRIVEKGSYTELMNINGIYAEMFESQKSWYINN